MYISRPSWGYVLATFLALSYTLKIIIFLDAPLWGLVAPSRYAAWRLTAAKITPGISIVGCLSAESEYWQVLAQDRNASAWFSAVLEEAATPSARLLALAGLQGSDTAAFRRTRESIHWAETDSIPVYGPASMRPAYTAEMLDSLDSGRLSRALWASKTWPEC